MRIHGLRFGVLAGTLMLAACSAPGATTKPTIAAPTLPTATMGGGETGGAMTTFCTAFNQQVLSAWPPDPSAAAVIGPLFRVWAEESDLGSVSADMTTVFNWLATQSISTTAQTPPADVTAAFERIKTFASTSC